MTDGQQLLAQYVQTGSETAFRELVTRYVDLVYSTAVRLVNGDTHLAEDVTQTVFTALARKARALSKDVMLGGWLHRHTCFVALNIMRSERRRRARERQAVEMNSIEDQSATNLALIAPVLDEAINRLETEDRTAILLRYFEQHDFRSVGEALGSSEEAARKRVGRALEKLEVLLKHRGVAFSATALATTLAAQAVTAAPAGLAISISSVALASAAAGSGATLTILKIMSMTKLKIGAVSVIVAAGMAIPLAMNQRTQSQLSSANESLRQQMEENNRLVAENERLSNLVTQVDKSRPATNDPSLETLRLRGEVGKLRQTAAEAEAASKVKGPSALSGITANPEMLKLIRDQQKAGLNAIYKDFTNRVNLPPDMAEKLVDLLADDIMENIDHITTGLREGKTAVEMDRVFAGQEAALLEKVKTLLGPEGFSQYQEYTHNLASHLTKEQFKGQLKGDEAAKEEKAQKLYQLLQEETQRALASSGLPPDFQTVPTLNFRNFASEAESEKNLKLLDTIYATVTARASAFLSSDEIDKFGTFRTNAINANRMSFTINRKMMAPASK